MSVRAYDDGDGRWDVEHTCDKCGKTTWFARNKGWLLEQGSDEEQDFCPECAERDSEEERVR